MAAPGWVPPRSLCCGYCLGLFAPDKLRKKLVKIIAHQHKTEIQQGYDQYIQHLGKTVTKDILQGNPDGFQRGNITGIEVGIVGFQNVRHGSGHDAKTAGEQQDGFWFAFGLGYMQLQRDNQKACQQHQIVKGYRVEVQIIGEESLNVAAAVNQVGVDEHQQKKRSTNGGTDGINGIAVLTPVKGHHRKYQKKKGTEMEGKMIQVIPSAQRNGLFSHFQQQKQTGNDLNGDHTHLQGFIAKEKTKAQGNDDHHRHCRE